MPYQWFYGVANSGIPITLITASGTPAVGYNTSNISTVISRDGGAWANVLGRLSGVPGDGVYTLASLSSTEMTCYYWTIKLTSSSGCLPQVIAGYNLSGYSTAVDVSGNNNLFVTMSGLPGILANTSNLIANASSILTASSSPVVLRGMTHTSALVGLWGSTHTSSKIDVVEVINSAYLATTLYTNDMSSIAGQVWNSLNATYTSSTTMGGKAVSVDVSGVASQVWNSLTTSYVSSPTFGGAVIISGQNVLVSGINQVYIAVSGIPGIATNVSAIGLSNSGHALSMNVSALAGTLVAVSGLKVDVSAIPGVIANTSSLFANASSILTAVSNTALAASGNNAIYIAISGVPGIATSVSSIGLGISSLAGTLTAVSGVAKASASSVAGIQTADSIVSTSGTLGHDLKLMRWHTWETTVVEKRTTPARQHYWNGTNTSSYFEISDDSNTASRLRGG